MPLSTDSAFLNFVIFCSASLTTLDIMPEEGAVYHKTKIHLLSSSYVNKSAK